MQRPENRKTLGLCCAAHFAVDFACVFLLLGLLPEGANRPLWLLLYNFCAFALQMPLGLLADRRGCGTGLAAAGCLLVAAAYPFFALPALAVPAAGIGNALFHVGAGLAAFRVGQNRCGPLGLFVSPGALGLYLGAGLAQAKGGFALFPPILLLSAAALLWRPAAGKAPEKDSPFLPLGVMPLSGMLFPAAGLFLVVCLRSALSLSLPLPWKEEGGWGLCLALATLFGKALGGLLADRFGVKRVSLLAVGLSIPLLFFCSIPAPGLMAVLLLNMTMPVTLWGMARLLPGTKGFAFGLLTFALFLGFLPGYLHIVPPLPAAGAAAGAAVSLLLLWAGLRKTP